MTVAVETIVEKFGTYVDMLLSVGHVANPLFIFLPFLFYGFSIYLCTRISRSASEWKETHERMLADMKKDKRHTRPQSALDNIDIRL